MQVRTPGEAVAMLSAWWPAPGRLTRWSATDYPSGLTIEFEREQGRELSRQRHFLQLADGKIVRHQIYSARPHGAPGESPAGSIPAWLGTVAEREPLTHPGQSGNRLERVLLADGRRLVLKQLAPGGDWVAKATRDRGRELSLWHDGVFERMPECLDHTIVGIDGDTIVMRDAGDDLVAPTRTLTRAESSRILTALTALHREFADGRVEGLCTLEDKLRLTSPAVVAAEAGSVDYLPKMLTVGWEVFAEEAPAAVVDAVLAVFDDPEPLAHALRARGTTMIHGDARWANLGLTPERVVLVDWGIATAAPPAVDFAWYLWVNGRRIDASYEELIDDFRSAWGADFDERALELSWLAELCWHAPLLAHELVESSDVQRERARWELDWWSERVLERV